MAQREVLLPIPSVQHARSNRSLRTNLCADKSLQPHQDSIPGHQSCSIQHPSISPVFLTIVTSTPLAPWPNQSPVGPEYLCPLPTCLSHEQRAPTKRGWGRGCACHHPRPPYRSSNIHPTSRSPHGLALPTQYTHRFVVDFLEIS